jgi:hypothetical protein
MDTGKEKTAPASAGSAADTGKAGHSPLDDLKDRSGRPLKDKTGVRKTWELMSSVITTPLEMRSEYPTMQALKHHCEREFKITQNDCWIVAGAVNKLPRAIRYPEGARRKSKAV